MTVLDTLLNRHCTPFCILSIRPTWHIWDFKMLRPDLFSRSLGGRYEIHLGWGHWSGYAFNNSVIFGVIQALCRIHFESGAFCTVWPRRRP